MSKPATAVLCSVTVLLAACIAAQAQERIRPLFNGTNLDGWHSDVPAADDNADIEPSFLVRNGLLVSMGVPRGHLISDEQYEDYRLEVEYRFVGKGGNCGVLVHASTPRALYGMFPQSVEVQMQSGHAGDFWCIQENIVVHDMAKRRGGPPEKWGGGPDDSRHIRNLTDGSEHELGQWNRMVIECLDDKVRVWMNGDLVNDGFDSTASSGQIALQAEGTEVEFRRVDLTPIAALSPATDLTNGKVRVFILAGQSNMEGKAQLKLLDKQIWAPETAEFFAHFHDDGEYIVRDDVWINYLRRRGGLTVGYGSPNRIGAELEFGHVVGNHFEDPVLLIKTAWGGKSIVRDFRPPSAGLPSDEVLQGIVDKTNENNRKHNEKNPDRSRDMLTMADVKASYGKFYRDMMREIDTTLGDMETLFPELAGMGYQIDGFVWFQGWNDQYNGAELEYESNMAHFIRDVRADLNAPNLPFVIGVMGQNAAEPAKGPMLVIQDAQMAMEDVSEFRGTVKAVRTDVLVDRAALEVYPNWRDNVEKWETVGSDFMYHYMGSAVWFTRIGRAFGEAMLELMGEGE